MNIKRPLAIAIALMLVGSGAARADEVSDLKAQMEVMQKQMDAMKARLEQVTSQVQTQKAGAGAAGSEERAVPADEPGQRTHLPDGRWRRGHAVRQSRRLVRHDDQGPAGQLRAGRIAGRQDGLEPAISTNLSYLGARGRHPFDPRFNFVWQLEAGIDISATPGTRSTNSNTSDAVNGALFSRNSFVGFTRARTGAAS